MQSLATVDVAGPGAEDELKARAMPAQRQRFGGVQSVVAPCLKQVAQTRDDTCACTQQHVQHAWLQLGSSGHALANKL